MESFAFAIVALCEDESMEHRRVNLERRILRDACNPFDLDNISFRKNFRLNKSAFQYVLEILEKELNAPVRSCSLNPIHRLSAVLRFFAEGGYQHGAGKDYDVGMAQSTISKVLSSSLTIFEKKLCPIAIKLEMSEEEKRLSKLEFYSKHRFPGIIMCVDGSHIKILKPSKEHFLYYNRKGFYSINAMVVCDYKMKIRSVYARYPGCIHDSHVWNLSDAKAFFEDKYRQGERNSYIIGDKGYPLLPWLMTPFRSPTEGSAKRRYNDSHEKARNIMERTIGVLKNRFRCILDARQLHYSPEKAV